MPRVLVDVQPGSGKYFMNHSANPQRNYGLSGDMFHHLEAGRVPYFTLKRDQDDKAEVLHRMVSDANDADQGRVVTAHVLGLTIPRGMKRLNSLLEVENAEAGTLIANIGDKYEAFQINLLHDIREASQADIEHYDTIGVNHFCTDVVPVDVRKCSGTGGNCPRMITMPDTAALTEDHHVSPVLVARYDLLGHLAGERYASDDMKDSQIYQLFNEYVQEYQGGGSSVFKQGVTMLGAYLPDETVIWIPIPDEEASSTEEKLQGIDAETVFYCHGAVYCDTLDIWVGYPFAALLCTEVAQLKASPTEP